MERELKRQLELAYHWLMILVQSKHHDFVIANCPPDARLAEMYTTLRQAEAKER